MARRLAQLNTARAVFQAVQRPEWSDQIFAASAVSAGIVTASRALFIGMFTAKVGTSAPAKYTPAATKNSRAAAFWSRVSRNAPAAIATTGTSMNIAMKTGFWIFWLMPCIASIAEAGFAAFRPGITPVEKPKNVPGHAGRHDEGERHRDARESRSHDLSPIRGSGWRQGFQMPLAAVSRA